MLPLLRGAFRDRRDQLHLLSLAQPEDPRRLEPRRRPPGFKFTLKAPKRITHDARLRDCAESLRILPRHRGNPRAEARGAAVSAAALLQQGPAACSMRSSRRCRRRCRAAFEFRHASWLDDEVFARLRARNLALCVADSEKLSTPVEITADYGYFRLRDEGYTPADIARWARTIREKTAPARTSSSTSSTRRRARARSSRGCCWMPSAARMAPPADQRLTGASSSAVWMNAFTLGSPYLRPT